MGRLWHARPTQSRAKRRGSAPSGEEGEDDVSRLSLSIDPDVEGDAAPPSTVGEPKALGKKPGLCEQAR